MGKEGAFSVDVCVSGADNNGMLTEKWENRQGPG